MAMQRHPARTLQRPRVLIWLLMGLALVSMPFTGWWMVNLVGWPLGQMWLLAVECALYRGSVGLALAAGALESATNCSGGNGKFTFALALFSFVCFIAIAGLMGAKPV